MYQKLKDLYEKYLGHRTALDLYNSGEEGRNNFLVDVDKYSKYLIPGNVLFLGCSIGHRVWAYQQKGWDAHGCDISEWAINNAITNNCINYDIKDMEYKDKQFDNVVGFDVLEHIPLEYFDEVLKQCLRITNKCFLARIPYCEQNVEFRRYSQDNILMEHMIHVPPEWWLEQFRKCFSGWQESYERVEGTNWWLYKYQR